MDGSDQPSFNSEWSITPCFSDGRYSFDMKRQPSKLSDLLAAWMKQSYCPDTHLVLDFAVNKVDD